jgi:ribosomal protein S18 acetylase RimI-like enzyme
MRFDPEGNPIAENAAHPTPPPQKNFFGYNIDVAQPGDTSPSLRPAAPDDAERAASIIYETMGTLGDYLLGQTRREDTIRVLAILFREKRHLLSYQFSTLAVEEGEIVGIAQAVPGADLWKATIGLARACAKCLGWRAAIRLAWRGFPLAFEPDAEAGEFYVETLAVAPAYRNRGIGRVLLEDAERRGRVLNFPVCSLSVMLQNTNALRFYHRAGYRLDRTVTTRLRAAGVQYNGFYRMIKRLEDPSTEEPG